jgi:hypothetical protein
LSGTCAKRSGWIEVHELLPELGQFALLIRAQLLLRRHRRRCLLILALDLLGFLLALPQQRVEKLPAIIHHDPQPVAPLMLFRKQWHLQSV